MKNIHTLNELADYINDSKDYPLDVEDIIEKNGWIVCSGDWDIAIDKIRNEKLSFTGNGDVVDVAPYHGGSREGAGRKSVFTGEKKKLKLSLTEQVIALLEEESTRTKMSKSDVVNRMVLEQLGN